MSQIPAELYPRDREPVDPPYLYPDYVGTRLRAPKQSAGAAAPQPDRAHRAAAGRGPRRPGRPRPDRAARGRAAGQRIIVHGRVRDADGRPVRDTLVEVWQANAGGATATTATGIRRRSTPTSPAAAAASPTTTGGTGSSRIKPGAYPWRNHENAWRAAHIHFSLFGHAFPQRLVTQMYFPDDPLFSQDPIFNAIPGRGSERLISRFDLSETVPEWALGLRVGHRAAGQGRDPHRGTTTSERCRASPSQTVGPLPVHRAAVGRRSERRRRGTPGAVWIRGTVTDGAGDPVADGMVETWQADPDGRLRSPGRPARRARVGRLPRLRAVPHRTAGRVRGPDDEARPGARCAGGMQAPHIDVSVFARGLLKHLVTRIYFADETRPTPRTRCSRSVTDPSAAGHAAGGADRRRLPFRHPPAGRR